jgi:hypothetical protein
MTASPTLIGLGAGIVAAVLFASLANNSALAFLLFYLTPLPVLLAGIGWGRSAALLAFLTSTALLGVVLSWHSALTFALFVGLPGFILSYLMLLHREVGTAPAGPGGNPATRVEWYPFGWVIAWAAIIAGALVGIGLVLLSGDADTYRKAMRALFQDAAFKQFQELLGAGTSPAEMERIADRFAFYVLPFFGAASWLLVMVANLWLATRSASISGLLLRPVPSFSQITYPPFLLPAFLVALVLSFAPGLSGLAGMAFLGAFTCAWIILGMAVLHVFVAGSPLKLFVLTLAYLGLVLVPWLLAPPLTLLGIADHFLQLRQRIWRSMTPPGNGPGPIH